MSSSIRSLPWGGRLSILLSLLVLGVAIVGHYAITDDAYISFRYLDNWLDGEGLVFNPGERVEGYTNFLWIVLLAPLRLLGVPVEIAATVMSQAALVLLLWAVYDSARLLGDSAIAGWAALVLAAGSMPLARWSVSGLETVAFAAFIALANRQLIRAARPDGPSSLLFGLATLTRPNGVLHAAGALSGYLLSGGGRIGARFRSCFLAGVVFVVLPLIHLGFRYLYYGELVPNTAHAKIGADLPSLLSYGFAYLGGFLQNGGFVLAVPFALGLLLGWRQGWVVKALLIQVLLHVAYVVWVGGDFFAFYRFFVAIVPALAVLGGVGLHRLVESRFPAGVRHLLPLVLLATLAQSGIAWMSSHETAFRGVVAVRAEREFIAEWLRREFDRDTLVAMNAVGLVPYRTGFPTIDMLGLTDAHIARTRAHSDGMVGRQYAGHFRHDAGYVCRREPDLVFLGGIQLRTGRNVVEAATQPQTALFPGDFGFLRICSDRYELFGAEIKPGRFITGYRRREAGPAEQLPRDAWSAEQWFQHGIKLMNEATMPRAIQAFRNSLALNPRNPAARSNLGFALSRVGMHEQAVAEFEAALRDDPQYWNALYGLALSRTQLGDYAGAEPAWRRYVDEAPESTWKEKAKGYLEAVRREIAGDS
ncbi:MAG: hypothetical protein Kow006_29260 [Gammaproteobacteria bacterium]